MGREKYFGISNRIACWKIDIPFENYLADLAGVDDKAKQIYIAFYEYNEPAYYDKGRYIAENLIQAHAQDFDGMDHEIIYQDMVYCLHKYGFSFQDYCIYCFGRKTEAERQEFVSDKLRYHYCDILNAPHIKELMTNKYECYRIYKRFFKRDVVKCEVDSDRKDFEEFIKSHPKFMYKPMNDHSGHGIQVIDINFVEPLEWFNNTIKHHPGIVEELIEQGEELNLLNPNSINSCRVVTFTSNGSVTFIGAALRMGCGSSITDNAGAGGIYASINVENGTLQSDAKNYLNHHYNDHPTTNTHILGFQLPDWEKAKALVSEMSLYIDGTTLISWDIAFSNKGWIMVEANENGDWSLMQSNLEKGMKKVLFQLMDDYFKTNK